MNTPRLNGPELVYDLGPELVVERLTPIAPFAAVLLQAKRPLHAHAAKPNLATIQNLDH